MKYLVFLDSVIVENFLDHLKYIENVVQLVWCNVSWYFKDSFKQSQLRHLRYSFAACWPD